MGNTDPIFGDLTFWFQGETKDHETEEDKSTKGMGCHKRQSNFAFFFFKGVRKILPSQWALWGQWSSTGSGVGFTPPYILVGGPQALILATQDPSFHFPELSPIGPVASMIYGGQYTREGPGQSRKKTVLRKPHPPPHLLQREMKGRENGRRAAGREKSVPRAEDGRGRPRRVAWLQSPPRSRQPA